jgi:asparagine synthase (glutamine-hydrolysing)
MGRIMCGIAGKINFQQSPSIAAVEKMTEKLRHRGPNFGQVLSLDDHAVFGHRRLSIIDLTPNANQPMQDREMRYAIVYNGEVYNFMELRKELECFGHTFRSRSDTEVVLYSFKTWGTSCFEKFNGMFACAIYDSREKSCVLARDKMGEKPLYYTLLNNELSFASECTALLEDANIQTKCTVSIEALNHYFALGYILSPATIYKEINKLEPATFAAYSKNGNLTKKVYWEYKKYFFIHNDKTERQMVDHLDLLINDSVCQRLVSDVPVGAFLSGGLDSSGIVSIARKHYGPSLQTYTVSFDEKSYNEGNDARLVADYCRTNHREVSINLAIDPEIIGDAIRCYDEPFSDTSLVPLFALSRLAAQTIKVVFSGDGADELFGGYSTYKADGLKKRLDIFPIPLRRLLSGFLQRCALESNRKMNFGFRMKQFSKGLAGDYRFAHFAWRELFTLEQRTAIIGPDYRREILETDPFELFLGYYDDVKKLDPLSQHLYVDAKTWLADDILVKIDRAAMAHSLETRCPYLDARIIEFAASIPSAMKLKKSVAKYILKKVYARYLPSKILFKRKSGFNAPIKHWLGPSNLNEFALFNLYVANERNLYAHE